MTTSRRGVPAVAACRYYNSESDGSDSSDSGEVLTKGYGNSNTSSLPNYPQGTAPAATRYKKPTTQTQAGATQQGATQQGSTQQGSGQSSASTQTASQGKSTQKK
ncbi:hypothetical protein AURDEDRAFT_117053 [Auricularia subglabra TFB-10046 SS5]|nr:hypothetical protein AURDEDRAFT_117053 [Auricularia subglabra TFB-10046 SS5]